MWSAMYFVTVDKQYIILVAAALKSVSVRDVVCVLDTYHVHGCMNICATSVEVTW